MLTRKQIQQLAFKNRVPLFIQERDYIQMAYLSLLYSSTMDFVFKGGTCLRIAYSSSRYSEDLDFNTGPDEDKAYAALERTAQELEYFGIQAELRNIRMSRSGFGFHLSYRGPLFDSRDITKGIMIRVDISLREEDIAENRIIVHTEYDDIRTFVLIASTLDHIFAEKVRALMVRGMARDLYDLWFLIEKGIKPDLELINRKLTLYGKQYSQKDFVEQIAELEKTWTTDLKPLIGMFVPYDHAAKIVIEGMERSIY